MWQDYVNALLGLCVLALAFLGLEGVTLSWTLGILGAAILVLGLWGALITSPSSGSEMRHASS
jgi:membrane-bound ClpP family serine protease